MRIDYTPAQQELRDQLRSYFGSLLTPEIKDAIAREGNGGPAVREIRQKMGADGWLGIGWPTEYGGQGRSVLEQFVFFDEATRAGAPVPMIALNTVGPTLMRHGTPEQKEQFLPRILAGTLDVAIGYTEPGSGTDLASLRTRAERVGEEFELFAEFVIGERRVGVAAGPGRLGDQHRAVMERQAQIARADQSSASLYPNCLIVSMASVRIGSFSRSRRMWTSTVRVPPVYW